MGSSTVIGRETRVHGPINCVGADDLLIEGVVDGPVSGDATVTIGQQARVSGEVRGRDVVIAGALAYNVHATSSIHLTATAEVTADLHAPRVAIDNGALFDGKVRMTRTTPRAEVNTPAAQPAPAARSVAAPAPAPKVQPALTPQPSKVQPAPVAQSAPAAAIEPGSRAIPELAHPGKRRLHRRGPG